MELSNIFKHNINQSTAFKINMIILMMFAFNFQNKFNYIMLGWVLISCFLFTEIKVPMCSEFIILVITFILYLLSYCAFYDYTIQVFSYYFISPIFCYLVGYNILNVDTENRMSKVIHTIVWSLFIHGMFTTINHISSGNMDRNPIDISSGSIIPATLHGFFFTMIVSLTFYVLFAKKNIIYKILHLAAIVFSIYATLYHASRTLLIIFVLVFFGMVIYNFYSTKKPGSKIKFFLTIMLLVVLCVIIYANNVFGIKDIYENSNFFTRLNEDTYRSLQEDGRIERSKLVLQSAWKFPFSGMSAEVSRYAHNLWLDTIRTVGFIPTIFLLIYTLYVIGTLVQFLKKPECSYDKKMLVLSIYLGVYSNFLVEPVLEGYPMLFSLTCILNGMVKAIVCKDVIPKGELV